MHSYRIHSIESAPEKSRPALRELEHHLGLIPNVAGVMAESPVLLDTFVGVFEKFHGGTFTARERQVLLLTNAVTNTCSWAVAFHSALALSEGIETDDVRAIREGRLPEDAKLAALSGLTRALIEKRGHVDEGDLAPFTRAGFGHDQVLEVLVGLAGSVMTNYAGNIAGPALEDQFASHRWKP